MAQDRYTQEDVAWLPADGIRYFKWNVRMSFGKSGFW